MRSSKIFSQELPRRINGIDFSGAKDAGRKIWMAGGAIEGDILEIKECLMAEELDGSARERGKCHAALREFIAGEKYGAFGLDFPFGQQVQFLSLKKPFERK